MNKIQYHSNEFFLLRDVPDKSDYEQHDDEMNAYSSIAYSRKLEACIADKTKIDNPKYLPGILLDHGSCYRYTNEWTLLKDGSIFDLPDNVEFEEKYQFYCMGWCDCSEKEYHAWNVRENVNADTQKVIHIKLKQEVKTELKCASEMGIGYAPIIGKDESQSQYGVIFTNRWTDNKYIHPTIFLSENEVDEFILKQGTKNEIIYEFKIQRIHPLNNRDMKIYINNIEFNTEHKISAEELCALVHINPGNASIIRRRHEDTIINISEILELQENDDFHITRNTLTTPDSAQGKFGRSIPEYRMPIIKTKMEPTKEDKPDFKAIGQEKLIERGEHTSRINNPLYGEELEVGCYVGEKIWNDYVIPEKKHNAEMQTISIEWRDNAINNINSLESENQALKKENVELTEAREDSARKCSTIIVQLVNNESENERLKSELDKAKELINSIQYSH